VANAIGVHRSFIFRLETGRANASLDTAAKLAEHFGMSIDDLFLPESHLVGSRK
jgi:DNA-binding XRE family transcriptional regulator